MTEAVSSVASLTVSGQFEGDPQPDSVTIARTTESRSRYAAAVLLDISTDATLAKPLQDLESAINTLKQSAAQAEAFQKGAASQKLALAIRELTLLKLLGNGLNGVKEAVRIAKEIASAVQDYNAASASTDATPLAAESLNATSSVASAGTPPAGDPAEPAAPAEAASDGTGTISAPAQAAPDPFYADAEAALAALAKYLHNALPALKTSPHRRDREQANALEQQFDASVTSTVTAAQAAGAATVATSVNLFA